MNDPAVEGRHTHTQAVTPDISRLLTSERTLPALTPLMVLY